MSYTIKELLSNTMNYGSKRNTSNIKYIVIHYTANDGDSAWANANYFHNNNVGASAHYFVDDDSVYRSVPENYEAWHCGGDTYYHSNCRNSNSIGIELCDTLSNGAYYPTTATINNALALVKSLMKKYNIPKSNVIRHYDVTHKLCPAYWCGTTTKNNLWKTAFWNKINESEEDEMKKGEKNLACLTFKQLVLIMHELGIIKQGVDDNNAFGDGTEKACKEIQKKAGCTVDGIPGEITIRYCRKAIKEHIKKLNTKITNAKKALS